MIALEELYRVRLELDLRRQQRHGVSLSAFDTLLRDELGHSHPYGLRLDQRRRFGEVLKGPTPRLSAEYVYRLDSLAKLLERDGISRRPDRAFNPDRVFADAQAEFRSRGGRPLPLTWAANGQVEGLRRIDFWTDFDLRTGDVERNAYRLGLPRNFFPVEDPIVLRCPSRLFEHDEFKPTEHTLVEGLNHKTPRDSEATHRMLRVPTVLDGYDFGPFYATKESDTPAVGRTVDLHDPENLKLGVAEFVGGALPVEDLEFVPIDWAPARSLERSFQANSPLVKKLVDFLRREGSLT